MVYRMDIIKLYGGKMKKIYSIFERLVCIFLILLLSLVTVILFLKYNSEIILVIIAYVCVVLIIVALLKLFSFPSCIIIKDNNVKVFDFPLLATNKFYQERRSLILWNSEIDINEVKSAEIVKLTKEQKLKFIGYIHFSDRYIKVSLKNSNSDKYIYVSCYSKSQIQKIIEILTKRNDCN